MYSFPSSFRAPGVRHPLAWAALLCLAGVAPAWAQAESSLPEVTVSSSGLQLGASEMTQPVSVLEGDELVHRRGATLGETLEGEPGITGSHFGAGASRPVIRGMDGARVRVLSDGSQLQDASTVSPDHAVVSEPLLATQVEVLRGPSALVYGAGAVGGVINVLDGKVPTAIPDKGYEGSAELRAGSAAREKAGAVALTGGAGNVAVHVEAAGRDAGDYRVGSGWAGGSRVPGSFNRTDTGSVGLSWVGSRGYLGMALTRQNAKYGLPGHNHGFEDCHTHGDHLHCGSHDGHDHDDDHDHNHDHGDVPVVDLRSERMDLRGELRDPFAGFTALRLRGGVTDYRHDEVEDGVIATTFRNKAHDLRVELQHAPVAGLRGMFGVQTAQRRFSAVGEEAYVQPTRTRQWGVFALEEYRIGDWHGDWRIEAALRHDRQTAELEDGTDRRSHNGTSASLGAVWRFAPGYAAGASLTRASRAPTAEELYARGLHMATSTYERGDAGLRAEASRNIDLSLRKTSGDTTFDVSVFRNRIHHYIYGRTLDEHDGLQLLQYAQADATFTGIEGRVRQRLTPRLGVTLFGDSVRARLDGGGLLPRIAPMRAGLRLDANWQSWEGQVEWVQVARQNRVAQFESPTRGYGMLHLGLAYNGLTRGGMPWQLYLKARNLTNRLAYAHTSFIKDAAPLAGRNFTLGMRVSF
ncbi:TonB-dependent receptor domain-containing protein [Alicycliphilus denitrificans]|uniref:TonB-dependent receptor domain-containing protein n=1 Tax=Alicycliphilus denitrificans TaxID=179636 RepID=UPI00384E17E5